MDRDSVIRTIVADRARLLAYAWSIVRDDHVAEDLYQDVVVAAMNKANALSDRIHVLKWSRAVLRNKALEYHRSQRSSTSLLSADVLENLEAHWDRHDQQTSAELTEALKGCLSTLTQNARELVEMRYREGMRGTEIAESTGRANHTVYVALSRAYKSLAECIRLKTATAEEPGHA